MNTQIDLLSDDELDTVSGGMANNGVGKQFEVPQNRTHGGTSKDSGWIDAALAFTVGGFYGLAADIF